MTLHSRLPHALIVAGVVVLDQLSKALLQRSLELHDSRPLIEGLLALSHVRNRGAAFGILSDAGLRYQGEILSAVSLAALLAIAVYAWRLPAEARLPRLALALVLGGAVGNLIDRLRFGYVVDFIHLYWKQHSWPDFNLADSAISAGVVLLLYDMVRPTRRAEPAPEPVTGRSE